MPKKSKNIYKRSDGRWEGRYIKSRIEGKAKYASIYGSSYNEVRDKLEKIQSEQEMTPEKKGAGTVSIVGSAWLAETALQLKKSTVNKYEDLLQKYILPEFGDLELSEITNEQLILFSNKLLSCGGARNQGLSKATVMAVISAMNRLRLYALRRDYAVSFNTECVDVHSEASDIRVFSVEEEASLVEWLMINYDATALSILLSLFTGIRIGELCALTWDDFHFSEGIFCVTKTMQRIRIKDDPMKRSEVRINVPKSECSVRDIPIPENLRKLLLESYEEGAYVTTGSQTEYVEPRTLANRFKSILKQAGIADANFHTTRHTFATRCVEQGFDIKCLSEILGHASVSITLNRYVHPSMKLKSENMKRMAELFPNLA